MLNAGVKVLALHAVGQSWDAADPQPPIVGDLPGMTAATIETEFQYGSGGESCTAIVRTTIDGGKHWRDIARFDFGKESRVAHCNLEGLLSKRIATYKPLKSEGVNDGLLGDALRCVIVSTGVYEDTTLSVYASVR